MMKPVILIGGTAGTGKTTLARDLCCILGIDHRLGTGFIREILRAETTRDKDLDLYTFTFQGKDPIDNIIKQATRMYTAVHQCIVRARSEGTSLIIEGSHLLPSLYYGDKFDYFIVLKPLANHYEMLNGYSHTKRYISSQDYEKIRMIDNYLFSEATKYAIPYLPQQNCKETIIRGLKV